MLLEEADVKALAITTDGIGLYQLTLDDWKELLQHQGKTIFYALQDSQDDTGTIYYWWRKSVELLPYSLRPGNTSAGDQVSRIGSSSDPPRLQQQSPYSTISAPLKSSLSHQYSQPNSRLFNAEEVRKRKS